VARSLSDVTLFSILDQVPVRKGISPAASIAEAAHLAQLADTLGYHRYWIAEHHGYSNAACTAPEIMIAHVAGQTDRIRVGSGAVLLPNHRSLHVAEMFLTLEALYPGRIDLGIGRSEGARNQATVEAFARPINSRHAAGYARQVDELLGFGGWRALPPEDPASGVWANPTGTGLPPVILLGSSLESAELAASRGLGYGFAAYTNPSLVAEAFGRYRRQFTPARPQDIPHAILGLRVFIGEDDAHGAAMAAPMQLAHVQMRAGTGAPHVSIEEALAHTRTEAELEAEANVDRSADVIGGPEAARAKLAELLRTTQADEVIVATNTFDPQDRRASYERLATVLETLNEESLLSQS
jgi:luciferase family oxidoreductase group 1